VGSLFERNVLQTIENEIPDPPLSAYDMGTHEGVNEKGLSAHALYLAVEAAFGERDPKRQAIGIMQWVQYFLDNYANGLLQPAHPGEGAAFVFSVIRNVSVPFGSPDPEKPNVASTIFRTVQDLTGSRYYFEMA